MSANDTSSGREPEPSTSVTPSCCCGLDARHSSPLSPVKLQPTVVDPDPDPDCDEKCGAGTVRGGSPGPSSRVWMNSPRGWDPLGRTANSRPCESMSDHRAMAP